MSAEIQHRRGTTAQWASAVSPDGKLSEGEIGIDTDLNQVKVGPPSGTPTAWGSIPWLGGTLPYFASPNSDLNDASNRINGRYRFTSVTNGPAAPIDIKAADGGINMTVMTFGTTVVQQLWTDGDGGTQVPKSYSRVYDGDVAAWRPWTPQSSWAISGSERTVPTTQNPAWASATASELIRADALAVLSLIGMKHFGSNGSVADLSDQGASNQWTVAGINTLSATLTPSAGNWWGMAIGFGGNPRQLLVIDERGYSSASGAAFTLTHPTIPILNAFLFAIRKT